MAEDAARELPNLPLEDALQLVRLYAERGSPKFEPAARRWLVRYLTEGALSLQDVVNVTASLAKRRSTRRVFAEAELGQVCCWANWRRRREHERCGSWTPQQPRSFTHWLVSTGGDPRFV
jgi:hypothetical protein